jgi:hypothetical protein
MNQRLIKIGAGAAAAALIALGGMAIARGSGNSAAANGGGFPGGPGGPRGYGFDPDHDGFRGGPGRGNEVTGATAGKVEAAVTAKYPNATVRHIDQLPDGSYLALAVDGNQFLPLHVSKDFKVIGTLQRGRDGDHGGPPGGGMGPSGAPPSGAAPQGSSSPSGTTTSQQ